MVARRWSGTESGLRTKMLVLLLLAGGCSSGGGKSPGFGGNGGSATGMGGTNSAGASGDAVDGGDDKAGGRGGADAGGAGANGTNSGGSNGGQLVGGAGGGAGVGEAGLAGAGGGPAGAGGGAVEGGGGKAGGGGGAGAGGGTADGVGEAGGTAGGSAATNGPPSDGGPDGGAGNDGGVDAAALAAWQSVMSTLPLPGAGCFTAVYPSVNWQSITCATAAPSVPFSVGGGRDYAAAVYSGSISQVLGSFPHIGGLTAESAGGIYSNAFSLQINSQNFSTIYCNGVTGCFGWEQFIFVNDPLGALTIDPEQPNKPGAWVFIQYWLLGYLSNQNGTCPPGWRSDQAPDSGVPASSCYRNSVAAALGNDGSNYVNIASLGQLSLQGGAGVRADFVVLFNSGTATAVGGGDLLSLAGSWTEAEFNIFGASSAFPQAQFNLGTTLTVAVDISSSGSTGVTCDPNPPPGGTTGETNNLWLLNDCSQTDEGIQFDESLPSGLAVTPAEASVTIGGGPVVLTPSLVDGAGNSVDVAGVTFSFSSEAPTVASVSGTGVVSAVSPGATTIVVTAIFPDGTTMTATVNAVAACQVGSSQCGVLCAPACCKNVPFDPKTSVCLTCGTASPNLFPINTKCCGSAAAMPGQKCCSGTVVPSSAICCSIAADPALVCDPGQVCIQARGVGPGKSGFVCCKDMTGSQGLCPAGPLPLYTEASVTEVAPNAEAPVTVCIGCLSSPCDVSTYCIP